MPGSAALMLSGAEELIARSAAFRLRTGAASIADAKKKIFFAQSESIENLAKGQTLVEMRPFCVMGIDAHGYIQFGIDASIAMGATGGVWALFCDNPKTPDDHKASYLDFVDWTSQIIDEVSLEVGHDTLFPFRQIELYAEAYRPSVAARAADDFWLGGYILSHAVDAGGG